MSHAWISTKFVAVAVSVVVVVVVVVAGCSGSNPFQAANNATATTVTASGTQTPTGNVATNPFIPDRNISDCIGTNERPNCGSSKKGGLGMWLTFAALALGVGFIMWRISIGVRQRDSVMNQPNNPGQY